MTVGRDRADVTEQKAAQRAVVESEARFRSLVQHLTDMILVLEDDGTDRVRQPERVGISSASTPKTCRLDARRPTDVAGRLRAARRDVPEAARARPGAVETLTARFRRGDGEYRWVEMIAVNQLDDPAVRGIVTNCRDITDRVDADAAIRASEERLQALVASASDVISVIDADGKLRYSSAVTTHVLGYPEGAGYGEHIFDVVHPEDRPAILDLFERAREVRGMFRPFEVRLQRADGSWMYAEILANNLLEDPSVKASSSPFATSPNASSPRTRCARANAGSATARRTTAPSSTTRPNSCAATSRTRR